MKYTQNDLKVIYPINQLSLFGYNGYFNYFVKLFDKGKMPNSILLSGPKGIGKSTFIYHIVNYILSKNEDKKYSTTNFEIDSDNLSYKLLLASTHPNFYLLDKNILDKQIKIENVRNLRKFLTKTSYSQDLKIVMIDNSELLNINSANALLKVIEEPGNNTFFFIIHDSSFKIIDTIKSRCSEFKIFFSHNEKKSILENIVQQYKNELNIKNVDDNFYLDTPGNIINCLVNFTKSNYELSKDKLLSILYLIEKYRKDKDPQTLSSLILFIEIYYNELAKNNKSRVTFYYCNYLKVLRKIYDMKNFNLDEKNILVYITDILQNEKK